MPGAASNQPPVPATAPINGASAPLQTAQAGAVGGGARKENVVNYEVDKTVRVVRNATGTVKRLNAAVVVNHRTAVDAKGKSSTKPLPQEELDKLTALVQEAVGFSKERNDSVKVINAPFVVDATPKADEPPVWKQPWLLDLLRAFSLLLNAGTLLLADRLARGVFADAAPRYLALALIAFNDLFNHPRRNIKRYAVMLMMCLLVLSIWPLYNWLATGSPTTRYASPSRSRPARPPSPSSTRPPHPWPARPTPAKAARCAP